MMKSRQGPGVVERGMTSDSWVKVSICWMSANTCSQRLIGGGRAFDGDSACRDLIGGEGERVHILLLVGVTVQVAIDTKGQGLTAVERVGTGEVELCRDKESRGVNLLAADSGCNQDPGVC